MSQFLARRSARSARTSAGSVAHLNLCSDGSSSRSETQTVGRPAVAARVFARRRPDGARRLADEHLIAVRSERDHGLARVAARAGRGQEQDVLALLLAVASQRFPEVLAAGSSGRASARPGRSY